MKKFIAIITNRNFILLLAIILGLSLNTVSWIKHFTVPALAIVMVVSLTQISFKEFLSARKIIIPSLYTILFNYFIFGAVMLLMAWFLIDDKQLWIGFVILASSPPGVAIAPFAYIIGADEKYSIIGMVGAYIASLAIIPIAAFIFIGKNFASPLDVFIIFVELIIAPMIVSQLLVKLRLDRHLLKWRGAIVNWGLFVVIFAVVSLNRDVFFSDIKTLLIISLISFVSVFGLWGAANLILKKLKIKTGIRKSLVLAATIKNSGFAAATALALFGEKSSLPGAILSIFLIIFLIIISIVEKKKS
ncbi:MAG: hypothetical protein FJW68_05025 [Actinobacteria bacterium]|nr:hypothetical protein [Actinomycetota bacterium]